VTTLATDCSGVAPPRTPQAPPAASGGDDADRLIRAIHLELVEAETARVAASRIFERIECERRVAKAISALAVVGFGLAPTTEGGDEKHAVRLAWERGCLS
jgi:hypothetical protein